MQTTDNKKHSLLGYVLKLLVPLAVTVGLCWVMFRSIDYRDMLSVIHNHCNFAWIATGMAMSILSHVIRAYRWGIQLRALGVTPPAWVLILSIFGTYAINLVFPRLGEVWRSGYIAHRQKADFSTVFGSMVAERFADTCTVLLLLIATFCLASGTIVSYLTQDKGAYDVIKDTVLSPWVWLAGTACVVAAWILLRRKSAKGSLLNKIQTFARGLWKGFASIATMPGKGLWLLLTVALWGCYFMQLFVAFFAFPFTTEALHTHGIVVALVSFVLSSVAMGVPSNGGIGPWQWAVMFALGIYGVSQVDAGAFANLVLGCQTLLLIVLGLFTFAVIMLGKQKSSKS